jgi:hypothetical protein
MICAPYAGETTRTCPETLNAYSRPRFRLQSHVVKQEVSYGIVHVRSGSDPEGVSLACREVGVNRIPRGLCHAALSVSFLSPMARRPEALSALNIASLIFRPDLGFLALTSFQSFKRPSLSFGSSSRISLRKQPFSVSRPRLQPPGNIHNRSRLLSNQQDLPQRVLMT